MMRKKVICLLGGILLTCAGSALAETPAPQNTKPARPNNPFKQIMEAHCKEHPDDPACTQAKEKIKEKKQDRMARREAKCSKDPAAPGCALFFNKKKAREEACAADPEKCKAEKAAKEQAEAQAAKEKAEAAAANTVGNMNQDTTNSQQ